MKIKTLITIILTITTYINAQNFEPLDQLITESIKDSVFPGAVLMIGTDSSVIYEKAYGHFTYDPASAETDLLTIYDMASLTKVFATTSCVMKLVSEGKLDIEKPVAEYLPDFGANGKENVKVKNLLLHNSGMPPYYTPEESMTRDDIFNKIYSLELKYETGTETVYSCLNFVMTMKVVEAVTGEPMYKYFERNIAEPLCMQRTMFTPEQKWLNKIPPTAPDLHGIVHDPLARGLKGLSGNAGLFATASDLSAILQVLMNDGMQNGREIFDPEVVEMFTTRYSGKSSRALGWNTNSSGKTSAGSKFSRKTFGHTGYTGTCAYVDPETGIFAILLTNRVYPDDTARIVPVRRKIHNLIHTILFGSN